MSKLKNLYSTRKTIIMKEKARRLVKAGPPTRLIHSVSIRTFERYKVLIL